MSLRTQGAAAGFQRNLEDLRKKGGKPKGEAFKEITVKGRK